ncbi:hypothetical protein RM531_15680 [Salinisphaera sp. P385]|uniref:Fluoride ion transporter CrcB n=1 Tax=Spectribacter acetivorans TaxID=3075603 RepID=A0ABU3BD10_9GAMM|nr:hypothetical protein [Salinisphaera sp. P385]MDT0619910.1 hypothetical protein [Salinisphaera sp. P385]
MIILLALLPGAWLGDFLVSRNLPPDDDWANKGFALTTLCLFVLNWYLFRVIADMHPSIRTFFTENFAGSCATFFSFGFLFVLEANASTRLPVPGWLYFALSIILSLIACMVFFHLALFIQRCGHRPRAV